MGILVSPPLSAVLPTLEEELSLSSHCCQGNCFMSVHMVGTCACPAPHVSARPPPQGPQLWGGAQAVWGEQEAAEGPLVTA